MTSQQSGRAFTPDEERQIATLVDHIKKGTVSMITTADISAVRIASAPHRMTQILLFGHQGEKLVELLLNERFWQRLATLGLEATYSGGMSAAAHTFEIGKENDPG